MSPNYMVLPLDDDNPSATKPFVTVGIMIACTLVYLWQHLWLTSAGAELSGYLFGVVPAVLTGAQPPDAAFAQLPPAVTIVTSMFLHGGFLHLAGNMLFLWVFGNNVEDAMGHARFAVFYLLSGLAAVIAQVLPNPASTVPMIGASGAISGVLGAYLLLYPRARVLLGVPIGFLIVSLGRFPAAWVLAAWFLMQLIVGGVSFTRPSGGDAGGIAFGAHVGGFVAGLLLVTLFKRRDVPLWRQY
jgi:rhomboid family protein